MLCSGQSLVALLRSIAPTFGATILAWSFENGLHFPLDQHFIFLLMGLFLAGTLLMSIRMSKSLNVPFLEAKRAAEGLRGTSSETQPTLSMEE